MPISKFSKTFFVSACFSLLSSAALAQSSICDALLQNGIHDEGNVQDIERASSVITDIVSRYISTREWENTSGSGNISVSLSDTVDIAIGG
jgi:hypothetical protein